MGKEIPDTKDIIEGLLSEGGDIFAIGGRPGIGKSWLLRQMALCLSLGKDFLGCHTKKCLMGIVAFEEPMHKIASKLEMARDKHFQGGDMFIVKQRPIWINTPEGSQYLLELFTGMKAENPTLKVIGLDPWKYLVKGIDKQGSVLDALANLKIIQEKIGISFVITHHLTQQDKRYRLDKPDVFSLKGFNDLAETAETVVVLERGTQERVGQGIDSTRRVLYLVKERNEFVYTEKQIIFKDALLYVIPEDAYHSQSYQEAKAWIENNPERASEIMRRGTP